MWCAANASDKERYKWRDALQIFAPTLWPQPSEVKLVNIENHKLIITTSSSYNLLEEWDSEENLSIVIVRHPLSRLASVYYQKFVELSTHKSWAKETVSINADTFFIVLYWQGRNQKSQKTESQSDPLLFLIDKWYRPLHNFNFDWFHFISQQVYWDLIELIRSIIKRYRPKGTDGPADIPTPSEYLRWGRI